MAPAQLTPSSPSGGSASTARPQDNHDGGEAFSCLAPVEEQPARSNSEPAIRGMSRASTFPRSSIRRSLALETTRGRGRGLGLGQGHEHHHHALFPIPSRDPAAETETEADGTPGTAHAAAVRRPTAPAADDKAARRLGNPIGRLRLGRARNKSALSQAASWKEGVKALLAALYQRPMVEGLLRRRPLPPSQDGRHIPLSPAARGDGQAVLVDERRKKPYVSNFIRSSRYTVYDFVPKQLLFQFSKLGNFYFLVMGILQMTPGLSTVGRWTTIVPLSFFVAFSMAKEGYDDYRRFQLDKSENQSVTWVLARGSAAPESKGDDAGDEEEGEVEEDQGETKDAASDLESGGGGGDVEAQGLRDWTGTQWQHVKVGDVVRLRRDDAAPADMVLLHASGPNGIAYMETMALDGETNLKSKQACPLLGGRCGSVAGIRSTRATVVSEDPNMDLYRYDGRVTVDGETRPLSLSNMVYRGSILRNTAEAVGLVVNSGEECKIRLNANKNVTAKKPAMHSVINRMVLSQIVVVLALAAGLTVGYALWKERVQDRSFYLVSDEGRFSASVPLRQIFFGYLIMFNTLIPLSLYISMEIVKLGQLVLLHDVDMYDPVTDTPMAANTTTILENLGQVTHVFTDKTGTLTENVMRFRKMSVAGVACLHDMDVRRDARAKRRRIEASARGRPGRRRAFSADNDEAGMLDSCDEDGEAGGYAAMPPKRQGSLASASHWRSTVRPDEEPEVKTEDVLDYMRRKPDSVFSRKARHLLLSIALCHTCLPERREDGELSFQAASPDELALVEAARDMGWLVLDRSGQTVTLQTRAWGDKGEGDGDGDGDGDGRLRQEVYQVLDVIEFSSRRKRMSVVVRTPEGRICVFCKGADNVILSRLRMRHLAEQKLRDVSRRASVRKTFEQDKARTRMSMASGRGTSPGPGPGPGPGAAAGRTSLAMMRPRESADRMESLRRSLVLGRRSVDAAAHGRRGAAGEHEHEHEHGDGDGDGDGGRDGGRDARIDESAASDEATVFERCFQHVDDFAGEGLRTLLYAYRYVDDETYAGWKAVYGEAETSVGRRQERMERAGELLEQELELAGATAIEDKLQEGVAETMDKLRRAGMRVWMLTGDKRETAINIGHSARVLRPYSEV
ncbi:hypothetical protein E4U53_003684, partial [Claviceps sorghi]